MWRVSKGTPQRTPCTRQPILSCHRPFSKCLQACRSRDRWQEPTRPLRVLWRGARVCSFLRTCALILLSNTNEHYPCSISKNAFHAMRTPCPCPSSPPRHCLGACAASPLPYADVTRLAGRDLHQPHLALEHNRRLSSRHPSPGSDRMVSSLSSCLTLSSFGSCCILFLFPAPAVFSAYRPPCHPPWPLCPSHRPLPLRHPIAAPLPDPCTCPWCPPHPLHRSAAADVSNVSSFLCSYLRSQNGPCHHLPRSSGRREWQE